MVFFALSRRAFEEFAGLSLGGKATLWVSNAILADDELTQLRTTGVSVTNFTRDIAIADNSEVDEAVATIREHHPNECLWVER